MSRSHRRLGYGHKQRQLRAATLRRDPQCAASWPGCTRISTEADHVVPLMDGGADELPNMQGLCHNCHVIKTTAELRRARARPAGRRVAARHPGLL